MLKQKGNTMFAVCEDCGYEEEINEGNFYLSFERTEKEILEQHRKEYHS